LRVGIHAGWFSIQLGELHVRSRLQAIDPGVAFSGLELAFVQPSKQTGRSLGTNAVTACACGASSVSGSLPALAAGGDAVVTLELELDGASGATADASAVEPDSGSRGMLEHPAAAATSHATRRNRWRIGDTLDRFAAPPC
jgi:hypothetical protein